MAFHVARLSALACDLPADAALDALSAWSSARGVGQRTAVCLDGRTLQFAPESGARAGYAEPSEGRAQAPHRHRYLGHLLALKVTAADQSDRSQVEELTGDRTGYGRLDRDFLRGSGLHWPSWCRSC